MTFSLLAKRIIVTQTKFIKIKKTVNVQYNYVKSSSTVFKSQHQLNKKNKNKNKRLK